MSRIKKIGLGKKPAPAFPTSDKEPIGLPYPKRHLTTFEFKKRPEPGLVFAIGHGSGTMQEGMDAIQQPQETNLNQLIYIIGKSFYFCFNRFDRHM